MGVGFLATIMIVTNIGFTVAFDTQTKCPSWVSYDLEPSEVIQCDRLPNNFRQDDRIEDTDFKLDYLNSGYDRGHLAPAADFNWSSNALNETYLFSNICPQYPEVNRGEWLKIEKEIRTLAESGTVHIVIFPYGFGTEHIGRVSVPSNLVKIAYGYFGVRMWNVRNAKENDR